MSPINRCLLLLLFLRVKIKAPNPSITVVTGNCSLGSAFWTKLNFCLYTVITPDGQILYWKMIFNKRVKKWVEIWENSEITCGYLFFFKKRIYYSYNMMSIYMSLILISCYNSLTSKNFGVKIKEDFGRL
jgi:hypothetical protein